MYLEEEEWVWKEASQSLMEYVLSTLSHITQKREVVVGFACGCVVVDDKLNFSSNPV